MASITKNMIYRLSLIQYAEKYDVTKVAIKYKTNRQYIYRWKRCYDGSVKHLHDLSCRPHHHPIQHTPEENKPINDLRSSSKTCLKPFPIECVQTDNKQELSKCFSSYLKFCFESKVKKRLQKYEFLKSF